LSGKLVRLPAELWALVAEKAKGEGKSLNDGMIAAARKWVGRKKERRDDGTDEGNNRDRQSD
jgi:hypothetical protein